MNRIAALKNDAQIADAHPQDKENFCGMTIKGMTAYNEAKRECENLVNYIDAIINTAMNGGDPMTVQAFHRLFLR